MLGLFSMGFRYSIQQPGVVNRDSVHIGALRARRHTLSNYELSYLERSSTGSLNRQRLRILGRIDHINLPSGKGSAQIILLTVETNTTALVSLTRLAVQKCSRHDSVVNKALRHGVALKGNLRSRAQSAVVLRMITLSIPPEIEHLDRAN